MKIAIDILSQKFEKVKENDTVAEALRKMKETNVRALIVVDDYNNYKGIVREKDLISIRGDLNSVKVSSVLKTPSKLKRSDEIPEIARHMIESDSYILPVFNLQDKFIGIIHIDSLLKEILENKKLSSIKVREVMTKYPITLDASDSIAKTIKTMSMHKISHIPIMKDGKIVGVVTSRDIAEKVIKPRRRAELGELAGEKISSLSNPVESIMTFPPLIIDKNATIGEAINKMFENGVSCLIVGNAEGIVTKKDLIEVLIPEEKEEIMVQVSGVHNLNEDEKDVLNEEIQKFLGKAERIVNRGVLTIYVKKNKRKEGENVNVRMRFLLPGKTFLANAEGYRFIDTVQLAFDKLEREIVEELEKQKEKRREDELFKKMLDYYSEL
ncbi:MAG: CBS domain-containing protein [Candidatus Aenigmarchaeota archaeon]|nr:CBS domain-containing protein [Candidatus Aenigmarchaeota archaeon]